MKKIKVEKTRNENYQPDTLPNSSGIKINTSANIKDKFFNIIKYFKFL